MNKNTNLKEKLEDIIKNKPMTLEYEVAEEALAYDSDNIENFFQDLLNHGCISGMVGKLIYYKDTYTFYDQHYYEIEDLRHEHEESTGTSLTIDNDLKNTLAWFGFEQTAYNIATELEIEF